MLKRFIFLVLIPAMLISTCSNSFIIAGFLVKRDRIASTLCIQKNKPGNCCKGACYLKKELTREQQRDDQGTVHQFKSEVIICSRINNTLNFAPVYLSELNTVFQDRAAVKPFYEEILRPPLFS